MNNKSHISINTHRSLKSAPAQQWQREDLVERVQRLAAVGLNEKQIHFSLKIKEKEWEQLCEQWPEIDDAIKSTKYIKIGRVAAKLDEAIFDKGNVAAMIFYLKVHGGWKEQTNINTTTVSETKNLSVLVNVTDPIEASRVYQSLMLARN